jgi:hypothetical protein
MKKLLKLNITFIIILISFICCSKKSGTVSSPNSPSTPIDPFNIALGSLVTSGITTSDGWGSAYYLPTPLNLSTTGGWTDSVTVSRDGLALYFAYSRRDAEEYLYNNRNEVINGAARTTENTSKYMQIFKATLGVSGWSVAYSSANYSDQIDLGAQAINSIQDSMLFTSYAPSGQKIKYSQLVNGSWQLVGDLSSPVNGSASNGSCKDDNPFIIGNITSGTVYWQSIRTSVDGTDCADQNHKIRYYMATVTNGVLSSAQLVPGISQSTSSDYEASFSEDKSKVYWTKVDSTQGIYSIYTADWNGSTYANARAIISINNFVPPYDNKIVDIGEPNVVEFSGGYLLYFRCVVALSTVNNNPSQRQLKMCVSKKLK